MKSETNNIKIWTLFSNIKMKYANHLKMLSQFHLPKLSQKYLKVLKYMYAKFQPESLNKIYLFTIHTFVHAFVYSSYMHRDTSFLYIDNFEINMK